MVCGMTSKYIFKTHIYGFWDLNYDKLKKKQNNFKNGKLAY